MKVGIIPVTPFQQNCSLLVCEETNRAAVVDKNGVDDNTRMRALLGLGHTYFAGGDPTNTDPYRQALLAFVRVYLEGSKVVAEVVDSGEGFLASKAMERGGGLGLVGMRERATMVGGMLTIDSVPGEGTCVRVAVPASQPTGDDA